MDTFATFTVLFLFVLGSGAQNIQEPAAILVRPPALSRTLSSQPLRLTCVAYGIPTPTITWTTTDGRNFTAETMAGADNVKIISRNVTVNGSVFLVSVLEVCATDTTYSKTYRCSADNGVAGEPIATSSAEFSVTVVTEPPAIVVRPPSNHSVDANGTVQLVCVAYGIPLPTITWSRPGCANISSTLVGGRVTIFSESMQVENTSFHKSALQLCNVEAGDASSYTCTANNGINGNGIASSSFSSLIEVNPIKAPDIHVTTKSPSPTNDLTVTQPVVSESLITLIAASVEGLIILLLLLVIVIILCVACSKIKKKAYIIEQQKTRFLDTPPIEQNTTSFAIESSDEPIIMTKACEAYEPIMTKTCEAYGELNHNSPSPDNIYERMAETYAN